MSGKCRILSAESNESNALKERKEYERIQRYTVAELEESET
jgi:hypothetical protein